MKKWYLSKTLWVNALSVVVCAIDQLAGTKVIPLNIATPVLALVNVVLRLITNQSIAGVPGKKSV